MANFVNLANLIQKNLILPGIHLYMVRHGQCIANHAGSIVGWSDSKLSIKGRQQSNKLYRSFYKHITKFNQIHSSDLSRCIDTLNLSLGFPHQNKIKISKLLREMNFGDSQGVHFDSLPQEEKKKVNSINYQAPNGQNWLQAKSRAMQYISQVNQGHHLIYTHGGLMCSLSHHLGLRYVVPNCSVVSVQLCPQKKQLIKLNFVWQFQQQN